VNPFAEVVNWPEVYKRIPLITQYDGIAALNSPALSFALPNAYFDSLGIPRLTGGR